VEISASTEGNPLIPESWRDFEQVDYELACEGIKQLSWNEAMKLMGQEVAFVDVREPGEMPPLECTGLIKVPFSTLSDQLDRFEEAEQVLCFCQSGIRSQKAAQQLQQAYPDKKIFSIRGGINALKS
jgi:adenylyltransferase/sulfurtransferase